MNEYTEENELYCINCGAEYEDLAAIHHPANGTVFKCKVCNAEDIWPEPTE